MVWPLALIDLQISCGILTHVSSKPREQLIAEWARRLSRLGLASTVQVLLPILEPLGGLAGQMLWMGQPIVRGLTNEAWLGELALLLEDPEALAELGQQLDREKAPAVK